ncbi:protein kri1-like [Rhododendron vialii]|uniref:protein kri1-like n=1 Tax=Rhododendron vialii TaxID=182163 RepID=UPI00265DF08A|nr:protein kri1-like [Rhododendron vialii]
MFTHPFSACSYYPHFVRFSVSAELERLSQSMGTKLFEGSDVSDEEDISKIKINKEFARRYEHNKKREDLQKLDELKKNGVVSCSSDSDESSFDEAEKDELTNSKRDLEFLSALIKVKKHDPELRNREAKLFESDDEEDESGGEEVEKRD